jgi:hypothetical protein
MGKTAEDGVRVMGEEEEEEEEEAIHCGGATRLDSSCVCVLVIRVVEVEWPGMPHPKPTNQGSHPFENTVEKCDKRTHNP